MRTRTSRRTRMVRTLAALITLTASATATACGGGDTSTPAARPGPSPTATLDGSPNGSTIVADGGDLPDGVYRVEFSDEHLADHGLDGLAVANNRGVWTTTLDDGQWAVEQVAPDLTDRFAGVYQVDGDDLYWRFHDTREVLHLKWSTDDEGDLSFTQITPTGEHLDFQFVLPWTRVD